VETSDPFADFRHFQRTWLLRLIGRLVFADVVYSCGVLCHVSSATSNDVESLRQENPQANQRNWGKVRRGNTVNQKERKIQNLQANIEQVRRYSQHNATIRFISRDPKDWLSIFIQVRWTINWTRGLRLGGLLNALFYVENSTLCVVLMCCATRTCMSSICNYIIMIYVQLDLMSTLLQEHQVGQLIEVSLCLRRHNYSTLAKHGT